MSNGVKVYNWIEKRFMWVVNGMAYNQRGDEHKRPIKAVVVVKRKTEKKP